MTEAFVFDAVRTPRGKGKKDGSLHEVKPVDLLAGTLEALRLRNDFDTATVDDVVMGVVSPIGEQGSVIAKVAALKAGWDWQCAGVQLNRFCASGRSLRGYLCGDRAGAGGTADQVRGRKDQPGSPSDCRNLASQQRRGAASPIG